MLATTFTTCYNIIFAIPTTSFTITAKWTKSPIHLNHVFLKLSQLIILITWSGLTCSMTGLIEVVMYNTLRVHVCT